MLMIRSSGWMLALSGAREAEFFPMDSSQSSPAVILRASALTKRYGDLVAVDGLSLEVGRGEILGFLGPNGAGKTTTLKMLCGLMRPDQGRIEINGTPLRSGARSSVHTVGVSPQGITIWEMLTCHEQLEFMGRMYDLPRATARERADRLLGTFGLTDKRNRLGRTLSGGMQRRLNIALALIHEPEIVFLDEPQAGLDPQSRVLVRDYVRSLAGTTTVVITTHDMDEAEKLSDRVCIIDHGRVLALDTVDAIKARLGEGDVFEVEADRDVEPALTVFLDRLRRQGRNVVARGHLLQFTASDGVDVIPEVLQTVKHQGLVVERLGMRKTTLEDVFIRLTGRGLRE
jgi:ABC-2 type transport system ATP-binding protein